MSQAPVFDIVDQNISKPAALSGAAESTVASLSAAKAWPHFRVPGS